MKDFLQSLEWNPLNWNPGTFEILLATYFIVRMYILPEESLAYYVVFILAMLMAGIATIRKDIHNLKQGTDND